MLIRGLLSPIVYADRSAYRFGGITLAIVLLIPRTVASGQAALYRSAEVSIDIGVALVLTVLWPGGLAYRALGGFQKLPHAFTGIALIEYGAARDQDFSASAHDVRYGVAVYTAVHFNTKVQSTRVPDFG